MDLVGGPAARAKAERLLNIGFRARQHGRAGIGRHASAIAADEAANRQAGELPGQIPERHIDRA